MRAHHMSRRVNHLAKVVTVLSITAGLGLTGKTAGTNDARSVESARGTASGLWRSPGNIRARNLFYGAGGESHCPGKTITFLKEDSGGSNPKFDVRDENGVKWKIKLGEEAQPEIVATRLLWAVGYYTDEDYFLPTAQIHNLPGHLHRGNNFVAAGGTIRNLRLEREDKTRSKDGSWPWRNGPSYGTREFNGLRVMMALINNWDLKDENNTAFDRNDHRLYEVSDLGAAFGTTRVLLVKKNAKGNAHSFAHSKFITRTTSEYVDFATPSLPSLPYIFNPFQYGRRARLRWIGRHISRADAKWIGELLSELSTPQIRDAFRAAGYSQAEIALFTRVIQKRIADLNAL
jgi:hypothetical protein